MFLSQALLEFSRVEAEVALVYENLASSPAAGRSASDWAEVARKERERSSLLQALAELSRALGNEGPFLVRVPADLAELRRVLERVRAEMETPVDSSTAGHCVEVLEGSQRHDLHVELLALAEPALRRVIRLIESEARASRRGTGKRAANRRSARMPGL